MLVLLFVGLKATMIRDRISEGVHDHNEEQPQARGAVGKGGLMRDTNDCACGRKATTATVRSSSEAQAVYDSHLMGRHLFTMLSYPFDRYLTTLIIDGTGVETD